MPEKSNKSNTRTVRFRWLIGLLGLLLVIVGQARLASHGFKFSEPNPFAIWLTEEIHLGVPSIDNVLSGLPFLLIGAAFMTYALRGLRLLPAEGNLEEGKTLAFRELLARWPWMLAGTGAFAVLIWRIYVPSFKPFQVPFWLFAIVSFTIAIASWDKSRKIDLSPHLSRRDLLWIFGLLLAGVLIGAYRLQGHPDQLMGDEGNFWQIARDIAQDDFKPSIFAIGVYTFPVFSSILPAWFLKIFGINLWGWRISSMLIGLLTVPPLYLLTREAFNRKIAVATTTVLITSPYFLVFSRLGYNNIQAVFVTTLALYWLYCGIKRKSSLYAFLAGCAAGLGFYVYFAARFAIVIALAFLVFLWITRRIGIRESVLILIVLLVGFTLVLAPHIAFGVQSDAGALSYKVWESVFFNSFNGLQFYPQEELFSVAPPFEINENVLFYHPRIYLELIARGFLRTMLSFQKPRLISEHYIAFPLAGTVGVFFYLIGLVLAIWNYKKARNALLLLWFFANVFGLSALNTVPPRHTHMVMVIPVLAIFTGMGINALANSIAAMHKRLVNHRAKIIGIFVIAAALGGLYDFFVKMPPQYRPHPDQVILWTGLEAKDESLYYAYTDPKDKDVIPRLVPPFREDMVVKAVSAEQIENGSRAFPSNRPTIIFYPPDMTHAMGKALSAQWGSRLIQRTFYSTNLTPVLAAGMNTPFVFERDKGFSTVLKDSYWHLSLGILLGSLLLIYVLLRYFPARWTRRIPGFLKRIIDWFTAPVASPASQDEHEIISIDELSTDVLEIELDDPEPPAWFHEQLTPESESHGPKRFQFDFKPVKTEENTDLYIRIRFPRFKFFRLRPASEESAHKEIGVTLPAMQVPNPSLLGISLLGGFLGQLAIHFQLFSLGIILYLIPAFVLSFWAYRHANWRRLFPHQVQITPKAEGFLLILLFLLMAYFRFYDLNYRVYGLEADEAKWTIQSWYSVILGTDKGQFSNLHYAHVPVDFWIRSFFLQAFGLNFLSARIESAFLSLLSLILLYWLIRLLTNSPATALLGTTLYGFSFVSLNASHQALHNTPIEPWMMGAFAFLIWGLNNRQVWKFQISGLMLAMGMLTYETFLPAVVLAILYMLGLAFNEIRLRRESVQNWLLYLAVILWPISFAYAGFTREYLLLRQSYMLGWLREAAQSGEVAGFLLRNLGNLVGSIFSQVTFGDSLINWPGPFLSPLLLPFVAIGLIFNLWNLRQSGYSFILLWFLIFIIPGTILTGLVWPRVMFPVLAPLVIWGALGLWVSFASLRTWFAKKRMNFAVPVFGILLIAIIANNYYIFTSALVDPTDRQKRRELADLVINSAGTSNALLFPVKQNQNDTLELEADLILFSVAGAKGLGLEAESYYSPLDFDQLLPSLWHYRDIPSIDVIFDKTAETAPVERQQSIQVMLECYPQTALRQSGSFFNVYSLSSQALQNPVCYQPTQPTPTEPIEHVSLSQDPPISFTWNPNGILMTGYSFVLEKRREDILLLEAEDTFTGPGWRVSDEYTGGFSGKGFLLDDWQAGQANHILVIPEEGRYRFWVRYYKRLANDQHNYFKLAGQRVEFADNDSPLNEWVWADLGRYSLQAGETPLALARAYGVDDQYSVFIDSMIITPNLTFTPGIDSSWKTIIETDHIQSQVPNFKVFEHLSPGDYRWRVRVFDSGKITDKTGQTGIESESAHFTINP